MEEAQRLHLGAIFKTVRQGALLAPIYSWLAQFDDERVPPSHEDLIADHKVILTAGVIIYGFEHQLAMWYGQQPEFWVDFFMRLQLVGPGDFYSHPAWHVMAERDYM